MKKILLSLISVMLVITVSAESTGTMAVSKESTSASPTKLKSFYTRHMLSYTPMYIFTNAAGQSGATLHGGEYMCNFDIRLYKGLYLELGAGISVNGAVNTDVFSNLSVDDVSGSSGKIERAACVFVRGNIPVNVMYRFQFGKVVGICPFAGINFGINIYSYYDGSSVFSSSGDTREDMYNLSYVYEPHRFRMGWQAGVNVNLFHKLNLSVSYRGDFGPYDELKYIDRDAATAVYGTDVVKRRFGWLVAGIGFGF